MMEFDDRYIALMDLYKQLRRDPDKEQQAEKAMEAASQLIQSGKVSSEAQEAARYL